MRRITGQILHVRDIPEEMLMSLARKWGAPYDLLLEVKKLGKLPVANLAAGGIATPADAALMMQLGSDGIFVGSGIFKSSDPQKRAVAIVEAALHFDDADLVARVSRGLGEAMSGLDINLLSEEEKMQDRGI
jgi:pyridoxal 5'-phosphate synthase pdxS subunit